MRVAIMIACIGCAVWPLARAADESPATLADAVTLASRVAELEQRVQALEAAMAPKAGTAKPVLEVHSESWCGPCQVFERELQARGEIPIEVKHVKFSSRVPAFRWTDATGKQVTRTGYVSGGLQGLIDQVLKDNVAQSRASE
jgi:hypothetical protein